MRYQSLPSSYSEIKQETTKERAARQRLERRAELTFSASDERRWAENRERVLRERQESQGLKAPQLLSDSIRLQVVDAFSSSIEEILSKSIKDGVYVWVETIGVGHSFISVFKDKEPTLYSYGRYGNNDESDGVLLIYKGDAAYSYMRDQLYYKNATVFHVSGVNHESVHDYFYDKYKNGKDVLNTYTNDTDADKRIKDNGKVIDSYDITSNNCTTHSVSSLRFGGGIPKDNVIPSSFKAFLNNNPNSTDVTIVFNFYYSKLHKNKTINESIEDQFTGFVVDSSGDEIISISEWINYG